MPHPESMDAHTAYQNLAAALNGLVTWKWDGRFSTALAEFSVGQKDGIRTALEDHLPCVWDAKGIGDADDPVQAIKHRLGGLMPGQLLFTPEDPTASPLFCAWWPWGNGTTISIRIGNIHEDADGLKRHFGVE